MNYLALYRGYKPYTFFFRNYVCINIVCINLPRRSAPCAIPVIPVTALRAGDEFIPVIPVTALRAGRGGSHTFIPVTLAQAEALELSSQGMVAPASVKTRLYFSFAFS